MAKLKVPGFGLDIDTGKFTVDEATGVVTVTGAGGNGLVTIDTTNSGGAADTAVLQLKRGGVQKWRVGLNASGLNADTFDVFDGSATYLRVTSGVGASVPNGTFTTPSIATARGVTGSVATNTFTTLFTPATPGLYLVFIWLVGGAGAYSSSALVGFDGGVTTLLRKDIATNSDFQLSGSAVQAKQTSGVANAISYAYQRIA